MAFKELVRAHEEVQRLKKNLLEWIQNRVQANLMTNFVEDANTN